MEGVAIEGVIGRIITSRRPPTSNAAEEGGKRGALKEEVENLCSEMKMPGEGCLILDHLSLEEGLVEKVTVLEDGGRPRATKLPAGTGAMGSCTRLSFHLL